MGYYFDLHVHTRRYSGCSNIDPDLLPGRAREAGLHGIGLTEHGIRWPDEEIDKLIERSGIRDVVLLPGQEVACYSLQGRFQGEFLVYGYPESLGSNKSAEQLIEMVHAEGGIVIAAHPFKQGGVSGEYYGTGEDTELYALDGLEIEHPSYGHDARERAREVMEKMQVAGTGSSDSHDLRNLGSIVTVFNEPVLDCGDLIRQIRERSFHVEKREAVR